MFICGYHFCGGEAACAPTPTAVENITYTELKNGIYDDWYLTRSAEGEFNPQCPDTWDLDTAFHARFNDSTNAGNIDWNLASISHIILKRRKQDSFVWKTLYVKEVTQTDDFNIYFNDYLAASHTPYEYAIVPALYGTEGNYAIAAITPEFNRIFLIEPDRVYSTDISDGFCDTVRNIPSSTVELLHHRTPVFIRNTIANYDTGTCTGSFLPFHEETCSYSLHPSQNYERTTYQREVMDFLTDGKPKLLKLPDSRMWIIQVTPSPSDTADQVYHNRIISFSWVEVGDADSEEDLYYLGLSDVTEEWWHR